MRCTSSREASESAALAASVPDDHGVYLVPAFVGLGAPHWEPGARGLICGLTLDSGGAHLARAALESVAYQTLDLTVAMARDGAHPASAIRVDGGMAANDWFCQFLADVLEAPVERAAGLEATVTGAAYLAGLAAGVWPDLVRDRGRHAQRDGVYPAHERRAARGPDQRLARCSRAHPARPQDGRRHKQVAEYAPLFR